jgi:hypothetical protein
MNEYDQRIHEWRAEQGDGCAHIVRMLDYDDEVIATVKGGNRETDMRRARLIAAAPELLAACEAMLAWDDDIGAREKDLRVIITAMEAAVAKARGVQP